MKRLVVLILLLTLLLPLPTLAQSTEATPEVTPTAIPSPAPDTAGDITVTVNEQPPAVASTDIPYLGLGFLVLTAVAVIGVIVYVVQHPTTAGLATALADAQKNRALIDALEIQAMPKDKQEALNVTIALLRVISGFIPSVAIVATIALLDDIRTPGLPPELATKVDDHDARLEKLEAQMTAGK